MPRAAAAPSTRPRHSSMSRPMARRWRRGAVSKRRPVSSPAMRASSPARFASAAVPGRSSATGRPVARACSRMPGTPSLKRRPFLQGLEDGVQEVFGRFRTENDALSLQPLGVLDQDDGGQLRVDAPFPRTASSKRRGERGDGELLDQVRGDADLAVPGFPRQDAGRQAGLDPGQPLRGDLLGRQIGVRIHPVRPGQDALEAVGPVPRAWRVSEGMPIVASLARRMISWAASLASASGPQTTTTVSLSAGAQGLPDGQPFAARQRFARAVRMDDVGQDGQAGDDPDAVGDLLGEVRIGLGLPAEQALESVQADAVGGHPGRTWPTGWAGSASGGGSW